MFMISVKTCFSCLQTLLPMTKVLLYRTLHSLYSMEHILRRLNFAQADTKLNNIAYGQS